MGLAKSPPKSEFAEAIFFEAVVYKKSIGGLRSRCRWRWWQNINIYYTNADAASTCMRHIDMCANSRTQQDDNDNDDNNNNSNCGAIPTVMAKQRWLYTHLVSFFPCASIPCSFVLQSANTHNTQHTPSTPSISTHTAVAASYSSRFSSFSVFSFGAIHVAHIR